MNRYEKVRAGIVGSNRYLFQQVAIYSLLYSRASQWEQLTDMAFHLHLRRSTDVCVCMASIFRVGCAPLESASLLRVGCGKHLLVDSSGADCTGTFHARTASASIDVVAAKGMCVSNTHSSSAVVLCLSKTAVCGSTVSITVVSRSSRSLVCKNSTTHLRTRDALGAITVACHGTFR